MQKKKIIKKQSTGNFFLITNLLIKTKQKKIMILWFVKPTSQIGKLVQLFCSWRTKVIFQLKFTAIEILYRFVRLLIKLIGLEQENLKDKYSELEKTDFYRKFNYELFKSNANYFTIGFYQFTKEKFQFVLFVLY